MAEPDPSVVAPWYLRNINQALELNEDTGQVFVRTGFTGNIIISGNVNIPGNVDAHISEIGTSGNLTVPWMPVSIDGNSNVTIAGGNVNAAVTGTVAVSSVTGNIAGITSNVTVVDGGGSLTVDGNVGITGNVNIGTMPNVNANITGGNVTVTQGTSPWVVSGNVGVTGNANVVLGGTNLDAFGRLRVSNPVTLFDSQNLYLDGQQFSTITAGGGTRTYVQNESSFNLSVGTTNGASVITQAYTTQAYQPGKSLLSLNTFAFATLKANLRQRVGHFTSNNGIFFEADGTTLYMVKRSYVTGVAVDTRVAQSSWNGDPLNGTGPSGITLDPTTVQIFWMDIEWLGVGNVRTGFIINGQFIVCHTFQHANISGQTTVYMTTATLNPRYEITNTGATASSSTMKQICSTVISEGGYNPATQVAYSTNGTATTRISGANTLTSLTSIRLNPAYPDAVVTPQQIDLLLLDVRYGQFQLIENATLGNAVWSNVANSVVQTSVTTDTITDGNVVYAGITSSRDSLTVSEDLAKRLQLKRYANGAPISLTLAVSYTGTNSDLLWKLGWQEVT